jgi:hypothetical protein
MSFPLSLRQVPYLLLLLLAACGKSNSSAENNDPSGGTGGKATVGGSSAGSSKGGSNTGGSTAGGSTAGGSKGGAGDDGGSDNAGAPSSGAGISSGGGSGTGGADEPSKQSVTFEVTNDAATPRAVVVEAVGCTPFMILATDPAGVVHTAAANPCGPCMQCPNPPSGTKRVAELAPGQSVELTWDARKLTASQQTALCNGAPAPYTRFTATPVAPGTYRVRVAVFSVTPSACGAGGKCDPPVTTTQDTLPYAALCSADAQSEAEFELPAEGDVTVPVSID